MPAPKFDLSKPSTSFKSPIPPFDMSKPSKSLVQEEKKKINRDFLPYFADTLESIGKKVGQAASGAANAVMHPMETAKDLGQSLNDMDIDSQVKGLGRAVRSVPIVGNLVNDTAASSKALGSMIFGGNDAESADKVHKQYYADQQAEDIAHEEEHPLTDFIQRAAGVAILPSGVATQASIMAMDAYHKSLQAGNSEADAARDGRNAGLFVLSTLGLMSGAKKGAKAVGNYAVGETKIPDFAIKRYREDPAAVKATRSYVKDPESLRQEVNKEVSPIRENFAEMKLGHDEAMKEVASTRNPPRSLGYEIPEHLRNSGKELKDLSAQSFDILTQEGKTFSYKKLVDGINEIQGSLKIANVVPTIGPDATAFRALTTFKKELTKISKRFPEGELPAPIVKELIQRLDSVSKEAYGINAGALSPEAAKSLAATRRGFDQVLKESSRNYENIMAELSPKVRIVNEMSEVFGDEQKSLQALKTMANPDSPKGHTFRNMLRKYDLENGTDFNRQVSEYYDLPKAHLSAAERDLIDAKNMASKVNLLGPGQTEKAIAGIQAGKNNEARLQLEALNPELARKVKDTGVQKHFMKSTTNGGRRAVVGRGLGAAGGAAIGGISNGPVGAIIGGIFGGGAGGLLGSLADTYGGEAVRAALDAGIKLDKIGATKYLKPIMNAAQKGTKSLFLVNHTLMKNDPEYRALNSEP